MPNASQLWDQFQRGEFPTPAPRKFTGRAEFRSAYYALILQGLEEDFSGQYVIAYHGIGGVGKSALLRRLEQELLGEEEPAKDEAGETCLALRARLKQSGKGRGPLVLRADFDDSALKTPQDVLFRFRSQVMDQTDKAMFPLFDMAMLRLAQKYGRRLPPDEQKQMLSDNPVISFALDVVGDLTGAGLLISAAQTAVQVGRDLARRLADRRSSIRKANGEMALMDAPELEKRLPYYFAMDMNAMDPSLVCVYLDTYERMTARAEGVVRAAGFDAQWLWGPQGLAENLGNAVFALAGREQVEPVSDSRRLEALSEEDSLGYLAGCGVEDEALRRALFRLTGGEPMYLDLCVDEYEHLKAKGKEPILPTDFSDSRERLVERQTRYVPDGLRDALYLLAGLGRWTDKLYDALASRLPQLPPPGGTGYYQLTHLSYVRREDEVWTMQKSVADILAGKLSSMQKDALTRALLAAAEEETQRLLAEEKQGGLPVQAPAELSALHLLAVQGPSVETARAMAARAQAERGRCALDRAFLWQRQAAEHLAALGDGELELRLGFQDELADILWDMGRRKECWETCRENLALCEGAGDGLCEKTVLRVWSSWAEICREEEKRKEAVWAREMILGIHRRRCGKGTPDRTYWMAQLRLGEACREADDPRALALLEEAVDALKKLDREEGLDYSPETMLAMAHLRYGYEGSGCREKFDQAVAWMSERLTARAPRPETLEQLRLWEEWVNWSMHLTNSGLTRGESVELQQLLVRGFEEKLGPLHPDTLAAKRQLADLYDQTARWESTSGAQAMEEMLLGSLGLDDAPVGSKPKSAPNYYDDRDQVIARCRELTQLYTMTLGREHPETYETLELLARIYEYAGRPEEAIPVRGELLSGYTRLYGAGSDDADWQESHLLTDYELTHRFGDAVELKKRMLARKQTDTGAASLCELYLEWLWQGRPDADTAEGLLRSILEQKESCGSRCLESAWAWCRANLAEPEEYRALLLGAKEKTGNEG